MSMHSEKSGHIDPSIRNLAGLFTINLTCEKCSKRLQYISMAMTGKDSMRKKRNNAQKPGKS